MGAMVLIVVLISVSTFSKSAGPTVAGDALMPSFLLEERTGDAVLRGDVPRVGVARRA